MVGPRECPFAVVFHPYFLGYSRRVFAGSTHLVIGTLQIRFTPKFYGANQITKTSEDFRRHPGME
jgi:hypothetical protein